MFFLFYISITNLTILSNQLQFNINYEGNQLKKIKIELIKGNNIIILKEIKNFYPNHDQIINYNEFKYYIYNKTGNFNFLTLNNELLPIEVLIIGGGGAGGYSFGGGGGAGGLILKQLNINTNTNYSIFIGKGGNSLNNKTGEESWFDNNIVLGGGYGGSAYCGAPSLGGSGGGSSGSCNSQPGGLGYLNQGNNGGNGSDLTGDLGTGGGGGGYSEIGQNGIRNLKAGNGGKGINLTNWLNGLKLGDKGFFSGGGGGGIDSYINNCQYGLGGLGGGGNGCCEIGCYGSNGLNGTGGGGGGGSRGPSGGSSPGGNGGSGIVIIKLNSNLILNLFINLNILIEGQYILNISSITFNNEINYFELNINNFTFRNKIKFYLFTFLIHFLLL